MSNSGTHVDSQTSFALKGNESRVRLPAGAVVALMAVLIVGAWPAEVLLIVKIAFYYAMSIR